MRFLYIVLLLIPLAACGDAPEPSAPKPEPEMIAFRLVGQGQQARLGATEMHIRDAATWQIYADSLRPVQPFGAVDFADEMILLAAVPEPEAGHSIVFDEITHTADGLNARYILSEPGDDCSTQPVPTVPFQAIRVPRTDAPVRFEQETDVYRCTTNREF